MRSAAPEYPIGLLYSTTGTYAAIGRDALDGALMALDEVNSDPAFPFRLQAIVENPGGVIDRTGACPNQHIVPLFHHVLPRYGTRGHLVALEEDGSGGDVGMEAVA